jgi:hypothetical protein
VVLSREEFATDEVGKLAKGRRLMGLNSLRSCWLCIDEIRGAPGQVAKVRRVED